MVFIIPPSYSVPPYSPYTKETTTSVSQDVTHDSPDSGVYCVALSMFGMPPR
jgi:hypothetical protein